MYATKQDMIDRYGETPLVELTDRVEPYTNAVVDSVMTMALGEATAIINAYISGRYQLPSDSVPLVLVGHTCVIAYYKLHRGRYPDEVRKEYDDTLSFLKAVSRGEAKIDIAGIEAPSSVADARVEGPSRIFNRDSLKDY